MNTKTAKRIQTPILTIHMEKNGESMSFYEKLLLNCEENQHHSLLSKSHAKILSKGDYSSKEILKKEKESHI